MADGIRRIDAEMAAGLLSAPATLHPAYVAADATRNSALEPAFFCYESRGERWLHGVHLTDVPGTRWRDASSPYGYGGPVASTNNTEFVKRAWNAYSALMREERVAVEYVRFHPVLGNEQWYGGNVVDNRQVVIVDLHPADIAAAYAPRLRQAVKKAQKLGLRYEEQPLATVAREFGAFHRAAMHEMGTDPFYVFDDAYFEALARMPGAKVGICRDAPADAWLAAALFLDGGNVREYHLAATNDSGRSAGASSFTLHAGALEAQRNGLGHLYLGGGTDAREDNPLYFFKGGFSPQRRTYRTGWTVFNNAGYDVLKAAFPAEWKAHPERPIFHRKV